ncbi:hypothetical protein EFO61_11730 [Lacticaseibacillus rhamnosus]|nr:Alpha-galactosidase [Lacticaseibacillus rhamnosus R0011]MCT3146019.1 hypothetical protein [Lacticaseibacillus rhamnosus]MCT3153519.1 hypothetical protein [Lacticaseibacillus rhamnosus]MCT3162611.1 hypothetical protein [Lacticaseibacillus rhamnosus]MCT3165181.1 hypothetical protein [Lacticaseibacillus rhamnosus]
MAGVEPSSLETLTFRTLMCQLMPITRSLAQGPACKDLGRNDQSPVITPKAAYIPVPNRASSRSLLQQEDEYAKFNW